jgi:hypothetical protein
MNEVLVLIMLWTQPNGVAAHLVLKADYTTSDACIAGLNHAQSRSNLIDQIPDDLTFECVPKADVDPTWLNTP